MNNSGNIIAPKLNERAVEEGLSAESLCEFVDRNAAEMDASQRLNFMRWDILNQAVHMNPQVAGSYEGEVAWVKNYLKARIQWLDDKNRL